MSDKAIYAVKEVEGLELFLVTRKDVYETTIAIRATSPEEAVGFVKAGQGVYGEPEHCREIDYGAWTVERDGEERSKG